MRTELKDFTGGITDYIYTEDVTRLEIADNLVITKDRDLESRWGSRVFDESDSRPVTFVTQAQSITEFNNELILNYGKQILRYNGTWEILNGSNGNDLLTKAANDTNQSVVEWNNHLFITDDAGSKVVKVWRDKDGNYQAKTAGLPSLLTSPTVAPTTPGTLNYVYSFCYFYEYNVDDTLFYDYGPVVDVQISNAGDTQEITNIPVLTETVDTHWDVANIKVKIYRTTNNGQDGILLGEINNGTTVFTDTTIDENLSGESLYRNGGIANNDLPPISKYIEIAGGCAWYANIEGYPYRVVQSQAGDPDSVPASYYVDVEENIKGISSYQSNVIVFTDNQVWRIEGIIDVNGAGLHRKVLVADKVGCLNNASIVKTDRGLVWAANDCFMWTNGYEVKKIPSEEKNIYERYREFNNVGSSVKGAYDRRTQRVYWITKNTTNNYKKYVLDLTWNALTTWSGLSGSFDSTSIIVRENGDLIRGDKSGYLFIHDEQLNDDPIIDLAERPENWKSWPVIWRMKHIAFDFGVSDINKWVTRITLSGKGDTSCDIAISSYDDEATLPKELVPIAFKSGEIWEDETSVWEDFEHVWELTSRLNQTRRFKSGKLRCKSKQIELTNAYTVVSESFLNKDDSRVVINTLAKTAALVDPTLLRFPSRCYDMDFVINGQTFKIKSRTDDMLVLDDPNNLLPNGTFHWQIKGYNFDQRFNLQSMIFTYNTLDDDGGYYGQVNVTR